MFVLDSVTLRNAVISGTINEEYLRELLTTMGDRFTDEEVSVTADRQTDRLSHYAAMQCCNSIPYCLPRGLAAILNQYRCQVRPVSIYHAWLVSAVK